MQDEGMGSENSTRVRVCNEYGSITFQMRLWYLRIVREWEYVISMGESHARQGYGI